MAEQLPFSSARYKGDWENGKMHGDNCTYMYPDGTVYKGQMRNGEFHGQGQLIFDDGFVEGMFEHGRQVDGQCDVHFSDGLVHRTQDWKYCTPADRRFWTEIQSGIAPAGQTKRTNTGEKPQLPPGTFDVGDGYFDPTTHLVHDYRTKEEVREPTEDEVKWIESKAPVSSARPGDLTARSAADGGGESKLEPAEEEGKEAS